MSGLFNVYSASRTGHLIEGLTPFEVLRDMDKKGELVVGGIFYSRGQVRKESIDKCADLVLMQTDTPKMEFDWSSKYLKVFFFQLESSRPIVITQDLLDAYAIVKRDGEQQ
ncbi:TPA: hypothetical protein ACGIJP_000982 [Acinetobacter baumannii]|uniref:hypothetical protein n=1 Tax=Acinetobacter baumannii TaxID=470 RepID=UPI0015D214BC|nr:hypothetical protein [Acinetobacter baumannii]MBI1415395.1 hypothetical protein [Acinetobacter baumannii]MBI1429418.1 hypothetical protein [Acinetobacter baumannii]QLI35581.1 hypothetical protein HLG75_05910 [Acinetobacter baumannii]HCW5675028.1 hypothetical protein [Acinetobacter baumannii]HCW5687912.1 hypothetical protein [Acinetobacter baumannii]